MGTASVTTTGKTCQEWTATTPHVPYYTVTDDKFPDGSRAAAKNYCRTLGAETRGPWCYTTDPNTRWEQCNIPRCAGRCRFRNMSARSIGRRAVEIFTLHYLIRHFEEKKLEEHCA